MKVYRSAIELIGGTPILELCNFARNRHLYGRIFAKAEFFNPGGSVKDRAALYIIEDAEKRGLLKKGGTVVEPTSGNTGIGLALICAVKGYKAIIVMPDTASKERICLARGYGAEVILTDGKKGMNGAVEKAKEIVKMQGGFFPNQFANPANSFAHEKTTAEEILNYFGLPDYFVSAFGSGGTISGVGRALKKKGNVTVVGVEPDSSPLLSKGYSGSHKIQGIGANFIPEVLERGVIDRIMTVTDSEAAEYARALAREEGLLCGISSGAALSAAAKIASAKENKDKNILVILPDTGERYLSTDLF